MLRNKKTLRTHCYFKLYFIKNKTKYFRVFCDFVTIQVSRVVYSFGHHPDKLHALEMMEPVDNNFVVFLWYSNYWLPLQ